ncbi:cohesin loading factor-domain-containing protein [Talaromyces proteolyticus]|uniref:Cohesin loading factor-domain-containing protein n=1 Tax=Talaromyces proteolyticus TaxID=1131652 RepID=A0AAD4KJC3_9EURO|nr:cohesin loading factor-domain-containing protein [Talaromyces proteolyticus]KAH8689618.1 cohesin loading factor-domain-containing protein [Talaromyces proteolyticus]
MSYPPPYNNAQFPSQYPPQYLQQIPQNPSHAPHPPHSASVPQQQYNVNPNVQYHQYTASYGYPQVILPQYVPQYAQHPQQLPQQQLPQHQHQHQQQQQFHSPIVQQQQGLAHTLPPQSPQLQQHQQQYHSPVIQQRQQQQILAPQSPQPLQQQPTQHQYQQVQQQPQHPEPPLQFVNPAETTLSALPIQRSISSSGSPTQFTHGLPTAPPAVPQYAYSAASPSAPAVQSIALYHNTSNETKENRRGQYTPIVKSPAIPPPPLSNTPATSSAPVSQTQKTPKASPSPFSLVPQVVMPSPSSYQKVTPKVVVPPAPQVTPKRPPDEDVDYQTLLLALADEYLNTAHRKGTNLALTKNSDDLADYYKLVATGLGCLEAAQTNFRLPPRTEALTRLRYARILIEETDNDVEAETALSKGIEVCERNKLVDLKYTMQQLLARMLHKSNPKAAVKAVDNMIQEVETYRHVPWEYAFRLLRVSLALSSRSHQEFVAAIHNLQKLSNLASRNGDKTVSVIAALIEALTHLQLSTNSDSVEQAQNAVAVARSHQLDPSVGDIPQIASMVQMVDISCSLLEYDLNHASQKLQIMQTLMDQRINDSRWRDDGTFTIPLNSKSSSTQSELGDILRVEDGKLCLTLNWLPQHDLYALCYFLSSVTLGAKNSHDGRKAEKYLQEGLRMVRGNFKAPEEIKESFVAAGKRLEWRRILHCNILLHQTFLACARTDWDTANQILKDLRLAADELGNTLPETISCLIQYATGVIAQSTGDLNAALSAFQSPIFSLSSSSRTTRNDPCRDTSILAALNSILILRQPSHPSHSRLDDVLSTVEPLCLSSCNRYIQAAYYLVCAIVHTDSTIQTKQYLQQALQSATAISNSQITCITLTFMSWKYFRGVIGEQAEKSARAGRAMAKKANDRLWVSVTDELLAEMLDRQGKADEAHAVREEADRVLMGLPSAVKSTEYR